jgi:tRNA A37 threonylcarbamoyladenosine synthetase subunit TsaC/SUA5/YrdC
MNKLKKNEIILFPTETVLGIGCLLDENCIKRLRKITKRPKNKPFAILLSD